MTEKRFIPIFDRFDKRVVGAKDNGRIISFMDMFDLLNDLDEENKQLQNDCSILVQSNQEYRKENEQLKIRFKEERDTAMRLGSECDNLILKNQKLELEIIRLEMIIKTGEKDD